MSVDRDLMDRLVQVVSELSEQGGEAERSRFYTGLIVLRNSGSGAPLPPTGFVQIRFEGVGQLARYFGNEPSVGDYVDVLMVYEQTPIILQNHTGGLTGPGWPFHTQCDTVDLSDPDADYATLAAAVTANTARLILISPELHTITATQTLNAAQTIRGMGNEKAEVRTTTVTPIYNTADGTTLEEHKVRNAYDVAGGNVAIQVTSGDNVQLRRMLVESVNVLGFARAISVDDAATTVELWNCDVYGFSNVGTGIGMYIEDAAAAGPSVYVYGGVFEGNTYGIYAGANCNLYLFGPRILGSGISEHADANVYGYWYDADGDLQAEDATTLTMTDGDIFMAEGHVIHDDGETAQYTSLWERMVAQLGTTVWTTHAREGAGVPTGCAWITTPAGVYVANDAAYTGYLRNTWYRSRPNHASLHCFLGKDATPGVIAPSSGVYARLAAMSGSEVMLRADNYDADRGYAIGERLYYYDLYFYGSSPAAQIGYRHGYWTWDGAAWTGPTSTGTGGPVTVDPLGDEWCIRLLINYGASSNTVAGYLMDEVTNATGNYGSVAFYVDGVPTPFPATRAGIAWRLNTGFANSSFDWVYFSWT